MLFTILLTWLNSLFFGKEPTEQERFENDELWIKWFKKHVFRVNEFIGPDIQYQKIVDTKKGGKNKIRLSEILLYDATFLKSFSQKEWRLIQDAFSDSHQPLLSALLNPSKKRPYPFLSLNHEFTFLLHVYLGFVPVNSFLKTDYYQTLSKNELNDLTGLSPVETRLLEVSIIARTSSKERVRVNNILLLVYNNLIKKAQEKSPQKEIYGVVKNVDVYDYLEVQPTCSNETLFRNIKQKQRIHHPDSNNKKSESNELFIFLTHIQYVLQIPKHRKQYNVFLNSYAGFFIELLEQPHITIDERKFIHTQLAACKKHYLAHRKGEVTHDLILFIIHTLQDIIGKPEKIPSYHIQKKLYPEISPLFNLFTKWLSYLPAITNLDDITDSDLNIQKEALTQSEPSNIMTTNYEPSPFVAQPENLSNDDPELIQFVIKWSLSEKLMLATAVLIALTFPILLYLTFTR